MKAKNNSNLKLGQQQMDLIYRTQLEGILNNIGQAIKIGTQQKVTHKLNVEIDTRIDQKNQNRTTGNFRSKKRDL